MMEIERLKNLQAQDEREEARKVALKRGQQVIIDQIKEREVARLKEEEMLEKEKAQMKKHIQQNKELDEKAKQEKQARVKIMLNEVGIANKQAIGLKEEAK